MKPNFVLSRRAVAAAVVLAAVMVTIGAIAVAQSRSVRWRAEVVALKWKGGVDDLSWHELFVMLKDRGGYGLERLLDGRSVHGVVQNPFVSELDIAAGRNLFQSHCAACHGADGTGETGPSLVNDPLRHSYSDWAVYRAVTRGIPGTPMLGTELGTAEAWQLVSFVRNLQNRRVAPHTDPALSRDVSPVTDEQLDRASFQPDEWLTYSGSHSGQRFSRLAAINRQTVSTMTLKWVHQFQSGNEPIQATPIVVGSVMYVSEPPNKVLALDASTGRTIWMYPRALPDALSINDGRTNRGVAVHGNRVFVGTLDAHLVALDAATGRVVWDTEVSNPADGYSITTAPLAVRGRIVVGVAGGEYGVRGLIDAYDVDTGKRLWRFYTVPEPGQPGNDSWEGESWRTGGGATWLTGSFDPDLNLLYWGVGNPAPDFNGDARNGDNLYTCSVVALDIHTGKLRWHFQFTPHDVRDWDSNQIPVLADLQFQGLKRQVILWANRNGFYYVLDRRTGEFLHGSPFVRVTWAKGLTGTGRPIVDEALLPKEAGSVVWPSVTGGTNWWSPSYNPVTELMYVPTVERSSIFFKEPSVSWRRGRFFIGGATQFVSSAQTFVRALRAATGKIAWDYQFEPDDSVAPSSVLSTAGGVVFAGGSGPKGLFVALDAESGRELWRSRLGGIVQGGPITFSNQGRQIVAVIGGRTLFAFEIPVVS